ncbi:MAG: hypothetical protein ABGY22_05160 [Acidimicrobiales bacterium]|jgi:hypothetical protein
MPIIKNNLYYELTTETSTKPVSALKIQLDVLDNCAYHCTGCFVNKRNNHPSDSDLKELKIFIDSITKHDILVDEILIGPTDFLSSSNTFEVLSNPNILELINSNSPILAFISTLQHKGEPISKFSEFLINNINLDTEIEIGIATTPKWLYDPIYISEIKSKLSEIDKLIPHDVTYTFILNIHEYNIDYEDLHTHIVDTFDTTMDLIPSIARSKIKSKMLEKLSYLNEVYNNLEDYSKINNIMVDHSHSGINFKVINFRKGEWFISPFLYENMTIYDDMFKVTGIEDIHNKMTEQYEYASGTDCESCQFITSCASRSILMLMKFLDTDKCVCPKENMIKHQHHHKDAASRMYDWKDYSVDQDREGYRKKFLVHDSNISDLQSIKEIYYANS